MDALLLGRRTYEIFADYWPKASEEIPFAGLLNGVPKYVASRTLADPLAWQGSTLITGDLAEEHHRHQGPARRSARHRQPRPRAVAAALRPRRPAEPVAVPGAARQWQAVVRRAGPCPRRCGWHRVGRLYPSGTLHLTYDTAGAPDVRAPLGLAQRVMSPTRRHRQLTAFLPPPLRTAVGNGASTMGPSNGPTRSAPHFTVCHDLPDDDWQPDSRRARRDRFACTCGSVELVIGENRATASTSK